MDGILESIKKLLGIEPDYVHFDNEVMMNINSVLMTLNQIGVGPETMFVITGNEETWEDFIGEEKLEMVKIYVYLKVKMVFDPPTSSFVLDSMKRQIDELEWRLNVQVDKPVEEVIEEV